MSNSSQYRFIRSSFSKPLVIISRMATVVILKMSTVMFYCAFVFAFWQVDIKLLDFCVVWSRNSHFGEGIKKLYLLGRFLCSLGKKNKAFVDQNMLFPIKQHRKSLITAISFFPKYLSHGFQFWPFRLGVLLVFIIAVLKLIYIYEARWMLFVRKDKQLYFVCLGLEPYFFYRVTFKKQLCVVGVG